MENCPGENCFWLEKLLAVKNENGLRQQNHVKDGSKGVVAAGESLQSLSKPCEDAKEIAQVGTVSANSDESVGNIIAGSE